MSKRTTPLVMTIDDDELINQIIELRLADLGYMGKTYTSPNEFLSDVKLLRPDLCVIDINFGDKSIGFLLIQAIRSTLDYYVPIIVLSGDSEIDSIAYSMEVGADDYIVKPPKKDAFADSIKKYLKEESFVANAPEIHRIVPHEKRASHVIVNLRMTHISDDGMYISCPSLVTAGVPVDIRGEFIREIFGVEQIKVMVVKSWLERETEEFGAYVEYIDSTGVLKLAARKYIQGSINA